LSATQIFAAKYAATQQSMLYKNFKRFFISMLIISINSAMQQSGWQTRAFRMAWTARIP
jgi:hypothetical protein